MLVQKTTTSVAKPSIKVRYVFDDDRDSTSNMELVEGTHFWWVPIVVFPRFTTSTSTGRPR